MKLRQISKVTVSVNSGGEESDCECVNKEWKGVGLRRKGTLWNNWMQESKPAINNDTATFKFTAKNPEYRTTNTLKVLYLHPLYHYRDSVSKFE
jgi:hypothetical protein